MIQRNFVGYVIFFSCCIALSCSKDNTNRPPVYAPPPRIAGKTYSADEVTVFKQLTFRVTDEIIKWPKRVSFYLVDTGYAYMTREIDSILQEINLLLDTNLVLTRVNSRTDSDVQIYLTDRDSYLAAEPGVRPTTSNYTGLTYLQWNVQDGIVYHGSVFVDMDRTDNNTEAQRFIIHHEMMHALGFYGHAALPGIYSILTHTPIIPFIPDYTSLDKHLMQLLYNPSIRAGMNEDEFDQVIKGL